jgi:hypothetical protein
MILRRQKMIHTREVKLVAFSLPDLEARDRLDIIFAYYFLLEGVGNGLRRCMRPLLYVKLKLAT